MPGSREVNLELSQRRAEAVVTYLTTQHHVAPNRLEAVGMGQEKPVAETPPQTPEAPEPASLGYQPRRVTPRLTSRKFVGNARFYDRAFFNSLTSSEIRWILIADSLVAR